MTGIILSFSLLFLLIFVNGFSDAPNAVGAGISSYALSKKSAITIAAIFDFFGVIIFFAINPSVAYTSGSIASFIGDGRIAVCSGMAAASLFALFASRFGIPTSESHAMSAAISGAAFFSGGKINIYSWILIFTGFIFFSALAFIMSPIIARLSKVFLEKRERHIRLRLLSRIQILFCILCAFMHGAQDGQKFIGLMMLFSGKEEVSFFSVLSCALVLSAGTLSCSEKIVKRTSIETLQLNTHEGASADCASFFLMLGASLLGIPVSTSSIKNTAMLGVKYFSNSKKPDINKTLLTFLFWLLTFPVCFLLGGGLRFLFSFIF